MHKFKGDVPESFVTPYTSNFSAGISTMSVTNLTPEEN